MSFGGSGLVVNCVALAILLRIDWESRQQAKGLAQRLADGEARIEGGVGVLEDDLHVAAEIAQGAAIESADVAAGEADRA